MHVADGAFVSADDETVAWVRTAYDDCDRADPAAYAAHFASDATVLWNGEAIEGRDAIEAFFDGFFGVDVTGLEHEVTAFWAIDPGDGADALVAMESDVYYDLPNGETVIAPATTMLEREGDEIGEARIYIDPAPIYE